MNCIDAMPNFLQKLIRIGIDRMAVANDKPGQRAKNGGSFPCLINFQSNVANFVLVNMILNTARSGGAPSPPFGRDSARPLQCLTCF